MKKKDIIAILKLDDM